MNVTLWGVGIFVVGCVAEGVRRGLQDRFGPNIIEGYRAYKAECRRWEEIKANDLRRGGDIRPDQRP